MPRIFHLALVSADLYQYGALSCSESWGSLFSALEAAPHGGGKLSTHVKQGVLNGLPAILQPWLPVLGLLPNLPEVALFHH